MFAKWLLLILNYPTFIREYVYRGRFFKYIYLILYKISAVSEPGVHIRINIQMDWVIEFCHYQQYYTYVVSD